MRTRRALRPSRRCSVTGLVFATFYLLLKRLVAAWKKRSRNAIG